jgi:single-stranded-DNA-specific exonuclease
MRRRRPPPIRLSKQNRSRIRTTAAPRNRKPGGGLTPSERAFENAFARLLAGAVAPGQPSSERDAFVERAFAKSREYALDRYASIADATAFHTKIVGVSFEGRQDVAAGLRPDAPLELVRQPTNQYDANAIAVHFGNLQLGFISRGIAAHLAPAIDGGARYTARVASLTGGGEKHFGVNVFVERDVRAVVEGRSRERSSVRAEWGGDADRVRHALIGAALPHEAQQAVLARVDAGHNTLAVLGTGRGKSFCFQYPAALRALSSGQKTLVVYPLRALANDQYAGLMRTLDPLGVRIYRANGSIGGDEREELFEALRSGSWDLVLATPEFLDFHRAAFAGGGKPAFVVVDEAHHLFESRHRPAYARLGETIRSLGSPQVLALTATAGDEQFAKIVEELDIAAWVIDPTVRENLEVVDARNRKEKTAYLERLFGEKSKGIVYCNSRRDATDVAQALRRAIGNEVMFYHAGMPTEDRLAVEAMFREGDLRVVVATSAFGEGIDLPDVEHVVLFHLNFDFAEFNQQAGRAGRDGAPAQIHLIYGEQDRRVNDYLIDIDAPRLATLRDIYRGLRAIARDGVLHGANTAVAELLGIDRVTDRTVAAAIRIFTDSGLLAVSEDDEGRALRLLPTTGKVDMERNERFAEGEATRESFEEFCNLALTASGETLQRIINRPIYPSRVPLRK